MIEKIISNIMRVPGVEGVCIFDREAKPLVLKMPNRSNEDCYIDLGQRLLALFEVSDEAFTKGQEMLLNYGDKQLFLLRGDTYLLLVFTQSGANVISLRMVTHLAIEHLKL